MQRAYRDGLARGPRAAGGADGLLAERSRRPAARVGAERARSLTDRPRVRPRVDGARVLAGRVEWHAVLPVRGAGPGRAHATRAQPAPAIPRNQHRRRLLASTPAVERRGAGRDRLGDQRRPRRRRVGRHRRSQAGEVDGGAAPAPGPPRADRRRRRLRLPCRPGATGSALASAGRARMGLPARARTATVVAALPALQPPFRCLHSRASSPSTGAPARSPESHRW